MAPKKVVNRIKSSLLIGVVIVGVIGGFFLLLLKFSTPGSVPPVHQTQESNTSNRWNVYTNTAANFFIQFPPHYSVESLGQAPASESYDLLLIEDGVQKDKEFLAHPFMKITLIHPNKDNGFIDLKTYAAKSYANNFARNKIKEDVKSFNLNVQTAYSYSLQSDSFTNTGELGEDAGGFSIGNPVKHKVVFVQKGEYIITFVFTDDSLFNSILSTFKG